MSHSVILPPVHDTSPPPFDDDVDENDIVPTIQNDEILSSNSPDELNNSNDDDWKSVDDNNDTDIAQIQDDTAVVDDEHVLTDVNFTNEEQNNDIDIAQIQDDTAIVNDEHVLTDVKFTNEEQNNDIDIAQIQDDTAIVNDEHVLTDVNFTNEEQNDDNDDWANFATFENKTDEVSETSPVATSVIIEENTENDWADFESSTIPSSEQPIQSFNEEPINKVVKEEEDDDDFGEFSEVQVAPNPQTSPLPTDTLSTEQIESLISTCFPMESVASSTDNDSFISVELPSFTTYKDQMKHISCLESSLSLWNILSNLSDDPVGIKFQWRKSNTERLFHQALGVNERFRTKNVPLTPEVLQPEKFKSSISTNNEWENIDNENKLSTETVRPHFDWKQSGLENPLADNDSSSLSSNISKNEDNGFDANKTLDLDFYVPPMKSPNEEEQITSSPSIQRNDSPIIQQQQQRHSIPIKTIDLYPGSTTTLNDDAKRIIDTLPNLSFMSAKALMFPIRFNANNNDESTSLY